MNTLVTVEVEGISKWYGEAQVLKNCSCTVREQEIVVICGPSGSGKSTLIKTINGLEVVQEGDIRIRNQSILNKGTNLSSLRASVGMVFQHFELFPHLTILQNLTIAQRVVLKRDVTTATKKAKALLEKVGMAVHQDKYPSQLSGGQQQRVAIARSLCMDPFLMLFDEPTSALDPEMVSEVLEVMRDLANEGMTMMVVTHEMGFARNIADRVIFMENGSIVDNTDTASFFGDKSSERAQLFLSKILQH
ncbi:MAG: amino acid ABC transporter ATP-binding protein [Azoarcus sp.]|jgi:glutamate/aspartate transport system ATP-binding protein|nr:amino acid ABC transporter ATP-binding protein [Azoarcus sp.]MDX9839704.1 amino acid ABC transporter ATP-binding protein [Azoarcus sp.]